MQVGCGSSWWRLKAQELLVHYDYRNYVGDHGTIVVVRRMLMHLIPRFVRSSYVRVRGSSLVRRLATRRPVTAHVAAAVDCT